MTDIQVNTSVNNLIYLKSNIYRLSNLEVNSEISCNVTNLFCIPTVYLYLSTTTTKKYNANVQCVQRNIFPYDSSPQDVKITRIIFH